MIRPTLLFSYTLWYCLLCYSSLNAQSILVDDRFENRISFWEWQGDPGASINWTSEGLAISHQGEVGKALLVGEQYLSVKQDFRMEATFMLEPQLGVGSFGLVWSADEDLQQWYAFEVRNDGYYRLIKVGWQDTVIFQDWTRHRKLKKIEEGIHYLKLEKRKWGLYPIFDDKELGRISFPPFLGKMRGMIVRGNLSVKVSQYRLYHPRVYVPKAGGTWPNVVQLVMDSLINDPVLDDIAPQYDETYDALYWTRQSPAQPASGEIWQAFLTDSGWAAPQKSPNPLNTETADRVYYVHPKGKEVWVSRPVDTYNAKGLPALFSIKRKDSTRWEVHKQVKTPRPRNQRRPVTWYISPKQNILLFSAELPGGFGDQDIYVCFKEKGGGWSDPKNLGPGVNSHGRECCPYYDPARSRLYFSSNSFPGYGRGDIYFTRRMSSTWTRWEHIQNLGPQINGPAWDAWFYQDPTRPRTYYYASQDTLNGDYDLFKIRVPRDLTEEPIVRVYGHLINKKTGDLLRGTAEAHILGDLGIRRKGFSGDDSTTYSMLIPYGELYRLQGIVPAYFPLPDTLDVRLTTRFKEIRRDLYLTPIEVGATVRLERVFFQRGKPALLEDSYPELNHLAVLMRSIPSLEIAIHGHTDNIGDPTFLQKLSEARAERVRAYLMRQGITAERLQAQGFGASRPIASNEDPLTRPLNRRVEFVVTKR